MAESQSDDFSDLTELGIDITECDSLTEKFTKCSRHVQCIAETLDTDTLLKLYALYKQGHEGPCNVPKPSWYDVRGKAKWEAWNNLGRMCQNVAKNKYIQEVLLIDPEFSFDEARSASESWVRVSSMCPVDSHAFDKTISDYIRSGDIKRVKEFLKMTPSSVKNLLDESGMGLVHYAADIGNRKILGLLIGDGLNLNLQDSEGQTALHYAASCGHLECVRLLLERGARRDVVDNDGCTAEEVADGAVKELFQS